MIVKIVCFNSFYIVNKILKYKNRLNIDLKNAKSIFAFSRFPFRVSKTRKKFKREKTSAFLGREREKRFRVFASELHSNLFLV